MSLALHCRFNPAHRTEFANAVLLARHYREFHADVYTPPVKVECVVCGKQISRHYLRDHMDSKHPNGLAVELAPEPVVPEVEPWTADHIVIPVVKELIGAQVPVDKLPAVFRWRDATTRLIEEVRS